MVKWSSDERAVEILRDRRILKRVASFNLNNQEKDKVNVDFKQIEK